MAPSRPREAIQEWNNPVTQQNVYRFWCTCGQRSKKIHGPGKTLDEAIRHVERRHWRKEGDRWTCPMCRVRLDDSRSRHLAVHVPEDLAQDLGQYLTEAGMECSLKALDNSDHQTNSCGRGAGRAVKKGVG
jgi:hypothetical protein